MSTTPPRISVSLSALPLGRLSDTLGGLAAAGASELYLPVSDGRLAPLCGAGPVLAAEAAGWGGPAAHLHLMIEHPAHHIKPLAAALDGAAGARMTVQLEGCNHPHRVLGRIRDAGLSPGVALWPGTPLYKLEYLLGLADRVVLLAAEPGGGKALPGVLAERVRLLSENLRHRELRVDVMAAGLRDTAEMATAARLGAGTVLVEDPALFHGEEGPAQALEGFKRALSGAMARA